ncbi:MULTISPECIES: hypothetical protein [unclassified Streptomyces]|uniref:hypothetical protein n=1 Tax=unclassified Streptomyces TaxID=2593676 RepID=UPI00093DAFB7|nr:hypothetical protein [Streptomyces sp. CB02058]OKI92173.1 hypothetical protein AMK10_20490 [Streptomyces sp. CB02058]
MCDVQTQHLAVAPGGDCRGDVGTLRAEPGVLGPVAFDPTVSRLVDVLAAVLEFQRVALFMRGVLAHFP